MQDWGVAGFSTRNYLVDAGGSIVSAASTSPWIWDTSSASAGYSFSGGGLIATSSGSSYISARGNLGKSAGKWYWEFVLSGSIASGNVFFGLVYGNVFNNVAGNFVGGYSGSTGYQSGNGNLDGVGGVTTNGATYAAGDIIGVTLDAGSATTDWYKNNVLQGTGTHPFTITAGTGSGLIYPAASTNVSGTQLKINFPNTYSPPSGYSVLA